MAKRTMIWAFPGIAFLVAMGAMLMSGPSWASLMRRTLLSASSTGTVGCSDCCKPSTGCSIGFDGSLGGGPNSIFCMLGGSNPVNYFTGEHIFSTIDLSDGAFEGITVTRAQVTVPQYSDTIFGPCWRWAVPQLIDIGEQVNLVISSRHARSWTKVRDTFGNVISYTPDFFYKDTLVILDSSTLVYHDENGNDMTFYNFTYSDPNFRGKLFQTFNAYGVSPNPSGFSGSYVQTSYTSGGVFGGLTVQEETAGVVDFNNRTVLIANLGGPFANLVCTSIFQFHYIAGVANTARSTSNEYYDGSDPSFGPAGCLKRVTILDPATNTIEKKYYRYGNSSGIVTVRSVVEGRAYERLLAAVGSDANVLTASNSTVDTYANNWQYDASARVTGETVLGKGSRTFSAASDSGFANDHNNWKRKVVETKPDTIQDINYTTYDGQQILKVIQGDLAGTLKFSTYYQYDNQGRIILEATPAAIASFSEGSGTLVTLNALSGLIKLTNYATSTTATTSTPGDVQGYIQNRQIKIGSSGVPTTTEAYTYIAHTSTQVGVSVTRYVVASKTVYENTDGTGARTTNYTYTWQVPPGGIASNQIESTTTTYPIVSIANNGKGGTVGVDETKTVQYQDKWKHPTYFKDEDGYIQRKQWNRLTGAMTQSISDVNTTTTTDEPSGWVNPADGGLHLTTNYVDDYFGRWTKVTDPAGNVTAVVYKDSNWETRTYPGWTGTATTGPTQVRRRDKPGSYDEELTTSVAAASSGGLPTGAEVLDGTSLTATTLHSLQRIFLDSGDRISNVDSYFTVVGLTYTQGTTLGVQGTHTQTTGTHFHRWSFTYEVRGLVEKEIDWTGTISKTLWDGLARMSQKWVGTSDPNLIKTEEYVYDAGGVGNGNLTTSKFFTAAATSLDTTYAYDSRDRRTDTRGADKLATKKTYDNLGRVTAEQTYADADSNFTIGAPELRGKREWKYDEKGKVFQTIIHGVDPFTGIAPGTLRNHLTWNYWYSGRGLRVKSKGPNAEFKKFRYDGLGRTTSSSTSFEDAESSYASAFDVLGDAVIDQTVFTFDTDGNVIQTTRYERTSSPSVPTGDLSTGWAEGNSRRSFTAAWFDAVNRKTSFVEYGRNGGTSLVRPPTPPLPDTSDAYIVTKYDYHSGSGRQYRVTDNKNRVRELTFDMAGRVTKTVENWVSPGTPTATDTDINRTTADVYDGAGRIWMRIAHNPKGGVVEQQTTQYVYGTEANSASPAVWRQDLLIGEIYPDSDDIYTPTGSLGAKFGNGTDGTYDRIEYTYDYAGRMATTKQQSTTLHTFTYDSVGRPFTDQATSLGTSVDGTVRRLEYAYDDMSRALTVSSYSAVSAGTLRNQVRYTYDVWGNEIKCEQGHEGTATGAPSFQKTYADGAAGAEAKYVRVSQLTYPNARAVFWNYPADSAVGGKLSRVDNVANDVSGTLKFAQYTYLGRNSTVKVAHPGVTGGLNLDLGIDTGNPGGWDDLGRLDDVKWQNDSAVVKDQYQYGYGRTSQRTFRDNLTATGKDHFYVYNGLDQMTTAKQGDLNAGRTDVTGTPAFQEDRTIESHGDWRQLVQTTSGTVTLNQTRTHTAANEVTTIAATVGTDWGDCVSDADGRMTRVPQPASPNLLWQLTYDAWGRLVKVVNNTGGATIALYKYDGRHRRTVKLKPHGNRWDRRDYFYSCEWQVVEERELINTNSQTTVATNPILQWVWGTRYVDEVILRDVVPINTANRIYYCQDANWNVTSLVDNNGNVVEHVLYDAYGQQTLYNPNWSATQASTLFNNEVLFSGYRYNPESGMYQVRYREYHPTLGRWVQRDPLAYKDSMNLYSYVAESPIANTDSAGLTFTWDKTVDNGLPDDVAGRTEGKLKMSSECQFCGPIISWSYCWKIKLIQFDVHAQMRYRNWHPKIGLLWPWDINQIIAHEMIHVNTFRSWHDENEPKAKKDLNTACMFKDFDECEKERKKREEVFDESFFILQALESIHEQNVPPKDRKRWGDFRPWRVPPSGMPLNR